MKGNLILSDRKTVWIAVFLVLAIYGCGLFVPLMDYDSSHHANIALHMHLTGNYAFLIDNGEPYLDKPHLLFWLASFSYKLFGVTSFAYRFPSFLFSLLAIYSTYRLGTQLYNAATGKIAALILSTAFAFAISIYDVRMEGLLTGSIIFATWQLISYTQKRKWVHLVLSALGLAAGFATKGMIGVVIPVIALLAHIIYKRQWKKLFDPGWIIAVLLFGLFISPVVYAYYLQFDLHPETTVKGQGNISGAKFILWNQSFQRMSGTSHGSNQSDFFFFFHTYLWAFLPWSILGVYAILSRCNSFIKTKFRPVSYLPEAVSTVTALFFLILFSFSKFKLPHYLNCLFPFFSIMLAGYLMEKRQNEKMQKRHWITQLIISIFTVVLGLVLTLWVFPVTNPWKIVALLLLFLLWFSVFFISRSRFDKYIVLTFSGFLFLLGCLNINFYPELLKYQAGNQLALSARDQRIPPSYVFYLSGDIHSPTFDFYSASLHQSLTSEQITDRLRMRQPLWLYTSQEGLDSLKSNGIRTGRIISNPDYRVSILNFRFINPASRYKAVTQTYIIELL